MSLSSMEEAWQVLGTSLSLLCTQHLRQKFANLRSELFFVNHVVACNEVWVFLLTDTDVV